MMKVKIILLFIALAGITHISAQRMYQWNQGYITQKEYCVSIPYTEVKNKLIIELNINDVARKFIFDTGAGTSALISKKLYNELGLSTIDFSMTVFDSSQKSADMEITILPSLKIGNGLTCKDVFTIVGDENTAHFLECFEADGIIGDGIFKNSIVQIDSRSHMITFTNNKAELHLNDSVARSMILVPQSSLPIINIGLHKTDVYDIDLQLLFDTGDDGFFILSESAYREITQNICPLDVIAESEGSFTLGIHGTAEKQYHYMLNIPFVTINQTIFEDLLVQTTYSDNSRLGAGILDYGIVTVDYKNELFYFDPFDGLNKISIAESPWEIQPVWQDGALVVGIVWNKALEKEINVGDKILKFNDIDYQNLDFCSALLSENDNTEDEEEATVVLQDVMTGRFKTVKIKRVGSAEEN